MTDRRPKRSGGTPPRKAGPKGRTGAERTGSRGATRPATRSRDDVKRTIVRAAIAFVVLGLIVGAVIWYGARPKPASSEERRLASQAPAAAGAAGCSAVKVIPPYPNGKDREHVGSGGTALPPLSSYPSVPPASGPHEQSPLDAGAYPDPPAMGNAIHSLEHGAVIVWYAPSQRDAAAALGDFFAKPENRDHVIVAPYDYPGQGAAGALPEGVGMALVAWHRMQTCATPSLPVAAAFVLRYATPTRTTPFCKPSGYQGDAPERCFAI